MSNCIYLNKQVMRLFRSQGHRVATHHMDKIGCVEEENKMFCPNGHAQMLSLTSYFVS